MGLINLGIGAFVIGALYLFCMNVFVPIAESVEFPTPEAIPTIQVVQNTQSQEEEQIITNYDISELNQEAIDLVKEYFTFKDIGVEITNPGFTVWDSDYSEDARVIRVGILDIQNDSQMYKMVVIHEYMHYILYRINLTDDIAHEALADTFTWYTNRKLNEKVWGENDSGRHFPYDLVMEPILLDNNFNCLNKVFVKTDKITEVSEFERRLRVYCNSSIGSY